MRLARYVAREFALATALALVGLCVLIVSVQLVDQAGRLAGKPEGAGALTALRLAAYATLEQGFHMLPVAVLLGLAVSGTLLARRGEWLAIEASGIGPSRPVVGLIAVLLLWVLLGIGCGEFVVPRAARRIDHIERAELGRGGSKLAQFFQRRNRWYQHGDLVMFLPEVDSEQQRFVHPVVYRFTDGLVQEVIEADVLVHNGSGWVLQGSDVYSASAMERRRHAELPLALGVRPADLIDVTGLPGQMSRARLKSLIERRQQAGFGTTPHRLELAQRWAYPVLSIGLFALLLPWALQPLRRRSLAAALGACVILIAATLAANHALRVLALANRIPVWAGAWSTTALCLAAAPLSFALTRYVRRSGRLG